jgi:hypothetical protein
MFKKVLSGIFLIGFGFLQACGATSSSGGGSGGGTITDGTEALVARDLASAVAAYCDVFDADTTDSEAAFGCFLATFISLPESSDGVALLEAFGVTGLDVAEDVLESVVETEILAGTNWSHFSYSEHPTLPLSDIIGGDFGTSGRWARIVNLLVESGTTHDEFQTLLANLTDDFEYMDSALDAVVDDTDFTFAIPAELFGSDADITVTHNDAKLLNGSIKMTVVSFNIVNAYDLGVEPASVLNADGTDFDLENLVDDLNGTLSGDTAAFLTLEDEALITGSQTDCEEALDLLEAGLTAWDDGTETTEFVATEDVNFADALDVVGDLNNSLENNTLTLISAVTGHTVAINLNHFFTNPPSSADVTDTDPFVYNSDDDRIEIVESFFEDFLEDTASF